MERERRVALITGAGRGIGFETARQLGQKGLVVVLGARGEDDAERAGAALRSEGIDARGIVLDVTRADHRASAARYLERHFGKLDVLINNAGIAPADTLAGNRTSETPEEELRSVFETNVFSAVHLTRELLPLLRKSGAGRIVNVSSILGSLTLHAKANSPIASFKTFSYNSSKTALNAFTLHLADELKDTSIKVNSVHPGWVKTRMGGDAAPMEISEGARAGVEMALIGPDGPSGKFIHQGKELPW